MNKDLLLPLVTRARDFDKSYSFHQGGVEERLALYFLPESELHPELARISLAFGLPQAAIESWKSGLSQAEATCITVNRDLTSFRLYSQSFAIAQAQQPFEIYQGFKALPEGHFRHDRYICQPLAAPQVYEPAIRASFAAFGVDTGPILAQLTPQTMIYAQIAAEARSSWLATIHYAELPPETGAAVFAPLADRHPALAAPLQSRDILHIAGGHDGLKGDFCTLYLAADEDEAAEFLQS